MAEAVVVAEAAVDFLRWGVSMEVPVAALSWVEWRMIGVVSWSNS